MLRQKAEDSAAREERIAEMERELGDASSLRRTMEKGTAVWAVIAGVGEMDTPGGTMVYAIAFGEETGTRVRFLIPYEEMFTRNLMDMSTVDTTTEKGRAAYSFRKRQMLQKMLGLRVPVCVTNISDGGEGASGNMYIASRRLACEKQRKAAVRNGRPKEGERCTATVISVSPHSLALNYEGFETAVQQSRLTERYLPNLTVRYRPGDTIDFVAENVKTEDGSLSFDFNTRRAELEDALARQETIRLRTVARGTITRIYTENGNLNIFAWLPDWEMPAKIPGMEPSSFGRPPRSGDDVLLTVTGFLPSGYLRARISSLTGNSAMFTHR